MRRTIMAAAMALAAGAAMAQPATTSPLPAPRPDVDAAQPLPGANSFTENQVRERLASAGFGAVENLRKDERGVWRGAAMRNGARVDVAVDYRGNVFPK
jgi:hypothetical protein